MVILLSALVPVNSDFSSAQVTPSTDSEQQPESDVQYDYVIVLDISGSMRGGCIEGVECSLENIWSDVQQALLGLISQLPDGSRVEIIPFAEQARTFPGSNSFAESPDSDACTNPGPVTQETGSSFSCLMNDALDRAAIEEYVNGISPVDSEFTALYDAVSLGLDRLTALQEPPPDEHVQYLYVLTDGIDTAIDPDTNQPRGEGTTAEDLVEQFELELSGYDHVYVRTFNLRPEIYECDPGLSELGECGNVEDLNVLLIKVYQTPVSLDLGVLAVDEPHEIALTYRWQGADLSEVRMELEAVEQTSASFTTTMTPRLVSLAGAQEPGELRQTVSITISASEGELDPGTYAFVIRPRVMGGAQEGTNLSFDPNGIVVNFSIARPSTATPTATHTPTNTPLPSSTSTHQYSQLNANQYSDGDSHSDEHTNQYSDGGSDRDCVASDSRAKCIRDGGSRGWRGRSGD